MDNNGFNGFGGEDRFNRGLDQGFNSGYDKGFDRAFDSGSAGGYNADGYDPNFNGGFDPRQYTKPVEVNPFDKPDKFYRCPGKEIVGLIMGIVSMIWGFVTIIVGSMVHALVSKYKVQLGAVFTKYATTRYTTSVVIYGIFAIVLFCVVFILRRKVYDQADIVTKKIDVGLWLGIVGAVLGLIGIIVGVTG